MGEEKKICEEIEKFKLTNYIEFVENKFKSFFFTTENNNNNRTREDS